MTCAVRMSARSDINLRTQRGRLWVSKLLATGATHGDAASRQTAHVSQRLQSAGRVSRRARGAAGWVRGRRNSRPGDFLRASSHRARGCAARGARGVAVGGRVPWYSCRIYKVDSTVYRYSTWIHVRLGTGIVVCRVLGSTHLLPLHVPFDTRPRFSAAARDPAPFAAPAF